MVAGKPEFVVVHIAQGEYQAGILKAHLESEGIPVLIQYESAGRVFGLTVNGLGQVSISVPREFAEEAKRIIEPGVVGEGEIQD
ncbi:MAG: DUF2007 domain-containing protein [Dehalococcoidia bacterium]|nr:DUF2007 domain-containing protein [Dehalococcoidia bacterium]